MSREGQSIFAEIERFPKPVIAAVGGYALGGGCELALACHIRVASENARFGLPEVGLGIIPGYGGTMRLSRLIGLGRAVEFTLTGGMLDAEKAERIGLVSAVYPQDELLDRAKEFARGSRKTAQSQSAWPSSRFIWPWIRLPPTPRASSRLSSDCSRPRAT